MRAMGAWSRHANRARQQPGAGRPESHLLVERCELHVESGQPGHARFHGLCHLKIQLVEPFQPVAIREQCFHSLHFREHVINGPRLRLDRRAER